MTRIVVLPDTQAPYMNLPAYKAILRFIGDTQPDQVIHIGDLMDYPTPSRWSKGSAEEFALLMTKHNEWAKSRLLAPLRDVYDGPVKIHEGNHDLRPRTYLTRYAPALAEFEGQFHIKELLDFDGFGFELLPDFHPVAPGWVTTHGHVGGLSLSPVAGGTAARATLKVGRSLVMGHTHRAGIIPTTRGYGGTINHDLVGVEVGHLMDMRKASYLKGGTGNWQLGFATLDVDGKHVQPTVVKITNKFIVDGETWEV